MSETGNWPYVTVRGTIHGDRRSENAEEDWQREEMENRETGFGVARCIFIGYDRVENVANRRARTRRNMATLLGLSYEGFCARFDWANLHGEEAAPDGKGSADARLAEELKLEKLGGYDHAVFVGNAVADAFGWSDRPFYEWSRLNVTSSLLVARTPHTSQRNWTARSRWGQGHGPWAMQAQQFMDALRAEGARSA